MGERTSAEWWGENGVGVVKLWCACCDAMRVMRLGTWQTAHACTQSLRNLVAWDCEHHVPVLDDGTLILEGIFDG